MSPTPWASIEAAVPTDSPTPEPSATPTPLVESTFPIAVVVKIDDNRPSITAQALLTALAISLAGFLMSCGGGGSGKAARTYTVTLTPSGSGSTVTNASPVSFVVTVQ